MRVLVVIWLGVGQSGAALEPVTDKVINRAHITDGLATTNRVEVIVNLRSPLAAADRKVLAASAFAQARRQSIRTTQQAVLDVVMRPGMILKQRFENIPAFSVEVSAKELAMIETLPEVASIEPVYILHQHLGQGIPLIGDFYRSTYSGKNMAIAICDTGVDYTHARLGGGGFPNAKVIGGYDTGDGDADPIPLGNAHGTACAGIAAGDPGTVGSYIGGVATNAKIYALKISTGGTGSASSAAIIGGWDWCVTHWNDDTNNPIKVISTSFGGGRHFSACDATSPSMTAAANNAIAVGITLFCSSGNDGYCDSMGWPACISSVISVGAVYDSNFGSYSPCISVDSCAPKTATGGCTTGYYATDLTAADKVTAYCNIASFLTVHAPANRCYTLDIVGAPGYSGGDYVTSFGGTSAACPYAAGAAACLQEAAVENLGRYLTPGEIKAILVSSGDNVTDTKVAITKPRVNLVDAIDDIIAGNLPFDPPYTESFEDGFGAWVNISGDDGNWTRHTGGTTSSSTGPSGASDGSYYLYTEASVGQDPGNPDKTANLDLLADLSGLAAPRLAFGYHMYGSTMGSLNVDVNDGAWHLAEWTISGQQHTSSATAWSNAVVDLTAYEGDTNLTIRMRGITGSSFNSDLAIDNLVVEATPGATTTLTTSTSTTTTTSSTTSSTTGNLLLGIASPYGTGVPPVGASMVSSGTVVTASIIDSPVTVSDVDGFRTYSCTGWVGTGSVPVFGTGTNTVAFTMQEDSSVTWLWNLVSIVLSNFMESGSATHTAAETIRAGDGYYVVPPANVLFRAGEEVRLSDGFHAASGSVFRATIDP